jgi:hypothetical protein
MIFMITDEHKFWRRDRREKSQASAPPQCIYWKIFKLK